MTTTLAAAERAVRQIVSSGQVGGWKLTEELGAGGHGSTWLATKKGLDGRLRKGVIKLTQPGVIVSREEREGTDGQQSFLQEFTTLKQLRNPHIAEVYDGGLEEVAGVDVPWLALERIEGSNLAEDLEHGPLTEYRWMLLARDLFEALDAVHEAGMVHLDIKPANIMLRPRGAVLIDFGIAETRDIAPVAVSGTMGYLAPEQIDAERDDADTASAVDMFKAGVTLARAATGRHPWPKLDVTAPVAEHLTVLATPPDLDALTPAQRRIVEPLLAFDPSKRPSAAEAQEVVTLALASPMSGTTASIPAASIPPAAPDPDADLPTIVRVAEPSVSSVELAPRPKYLTPPAAAATPPGPAVLPPPVAASPQADAQSFPPPVAPSPPAASPAAAQSFPPPVARPVLPPPSPADHRPTGVLPPPTVPQYAPANVPPPPKGGQGDLMTTIALLVVGGFGVLGSFLIAFFMVSPEMNAETPDEYAVFNPGGWPALLVISHLLIYAAVVVGVVLRRRAGGSSFWIPLAGGGLAGLIFVISFVGFSLTSIPI